METRKSEKACYSPILDRKKQSESKNDQNIKWIKFCFLYDCSVILNINEFCEKKDLCGS